MEIAAVTILKTLSEIYGIYWILGLVVFIIVAVLSIFVISIATKTPFGFGIGIFKINFGNRGSTVNRSGLINGLLEHQEELSRNVFRIENYCLKKQLNYTEQKLSQFKYLLTNSYSAALQLKLQANEDVKLHKDYRSYQILIGLLINELLDRIFQEAYVENHLEAFDENDWNIYINDKATYIINFTTDFLDNMYGDGRLVTRKEAYEEEKKLFSEIKEMMKIIFENARDISIQTRLDISKEKEKAELSMKEICKNNGFALEEGK